MPRMGHERGKFQVPCDVRCLSSGLVFEGKARVKYKLAKKLAEQVPPHFIWFSLPEFFACAASMKYRRTFFLTLLHGN